MSQVTCDDANGPPSPASTYNKWHGWWAAGKTTFHINAVHHWLLEYYKQWAGEAEARDSVIVPLCGKTMDLVALAERGHQVLGVEWVPQAIDKFWSETCQVDSKKVVHETVGSYDVSTCPMDNLAGKVVMARGDFFSLDKSDVMPRAFNGEKTAGLIWDRAALVAVKPTERKDYVAAEARLVKSGGHLLLVALKYEKADENAKNGPPHSVPSNEVFSLYSEYFEVTQLIDNVRDPSYDRFKPNGWLDIREHVYLMTRK